MGGPCSEDGLHEEGPFEIKGNKIFTKSNLCEHQDVFEIVDKIPLGFYIWNIGENMGSDEWIPLAQDLKPGDKENFEINPDTLKAIRLKPEEVQILRKSAGIGVNNLKTAERALKSKRRGYWSDRKRKAAEMTIDIFREISE